MAIKPSKVSFKYGAGEFIASTRHVEIAEIVKSYSPYILRHDDKFVFLLRCEQITSIYRLGELKRVNCYMDAVEEFGEKTFDPKDIYYDAVTRAFLECIKYEPAYIVPVLRKKLVFRVKRQKKVDMKKCLEDYSALMGAVSVPGD